MGKSESLTVSLPPELALLVESQLATGFFDDPEDVVSAALGLLPLQRVPASDALAALAGISDGLCLMDSEWRVTFVNDAAETYFRAPRREVVGRSFWTAAPETVGTIWEWHLGRAMRERLSVEFEAPFLDRADQWLEVRAFPVGRGIGIAARDVTERVAAAKALAESAARLRETYQSLQIAHKAAQAATWEWRWPEKVIVWTDQTASRELLRGAVDQSVSSFDDSLSTAVEEDRPKAFAAMKQMGRDGEGYFEYRAVGSKGPTRWLAMSGKVTERNAKGAATRMIGILIDITRQKLVEESLRAEIAERLRAEQRQRLLINELNHRVKNTLATVQSMARQSLTGTADKQTPLERFTDRLLALSAAHDVLTVENWQGAPLGEIVACALRAYQTPKSRFFVQGPPLRVGPRAALTLAMALHELATNALKYGALSNAAGRVLIQWETDGQAEGGRLDLVWREVGGPAVAPPTRRGFGSRLIERGVSSELAAEVELRFEPEGVVFRLTTELPVEQVLSLG